MRRTRRIRKTYRQRGGYTNADLKKAIHDKDLVMVQTILKDPQIDPTIDDNALLFESVIHNNVELLDIFLKDSRIDPSIQDNEALFLAEKTDSIDVFKRLLADPRMDPGARENTLIVQASEDASFQVKDFTEYILPLLDHSNVDPSVEDNIVLWNILQSYISHIADSDDATGYNPVFVKLLEDARVIKGTYTMGRTEKILEISIEYNNTELISAIVANPSILKALIAYDSDILRDACEGKYSEEINRILTSGFDCVAQGWLNSDSSAYVTDEEEEDEDEVELEEVVIKYDNQQARNLIELEEKPLLTLMCDRNNLVVQLGPVFFLCYVDRIKKEIAKHTHTRYECKEKLDGAPYVKDVITENPYYLLTGEAGSFLVPMNQIQAATKKYAAIQLVASDKTLPFVASRAVVQQEPGISMNGSNVNIVSADHCQAGTDKKVYTIRGITFT